MSFRPIGRSAWTSSGPGGGPISTPVPHSILHNTAGAQPLPNASRAQEEAMIRGTRDFHMNSRGMSDIAYNYAAFPSGRGYELRGVRTGGHTACCNSTGLAVVAFGNYDQHEPNEDLLQVIRSLWAYLLGRGAIPPRAAGHPEWGHRDAPGAATSCPGSKLYARMDDLRQPAKVRRYIVSDIDGDRPTSPTELNKALRRLRRRGRQAGRPFAHKKLGWERFVDDASLAKAIDGIRTRLREAREPQTWVLQAGARRFKIRAVEQ